MSSALQRTPTLWLVRHATPLIEPGVCYGQLDVPACPQDTAQAAQRLAAELPLQAVMWVSPLKRCWQLALALQHHRADLRPRIDARLMELRFGAWEGQLWDDVGSAATDAWAHDLWAYEPGGGESVADLMARVGAAWDDGLRAPSATVWITHAGVVRVAKLLSRGQRGPLAAAEWPREALGMGEALCLPMEGGVQASHADYRSAVPA
jgi:alpha-ribazole phosphatase